MEKASVGYGERPVLRRLTLRIDDDDRIGLFGANGNGKSTLAKLLGGRLAPMSGHMTRAQQARSRRFSPSTRSTNSTRGHAL